MALAPLLAGQEHDNPAHRLIGALLKSNRDAAISSLKEVASQTRFVDQFFTEFFWSNLPVLIYQRICELELLPALEPLRISTGQTLLSAIREKVVTSNFDYQTHGSKLLQLIELLDDLGKHVVWLKGTVLSRTLYEQENHRLSIDFDFVVDQAYKNQVLARLEANHFVPVWSEPGYCHQVGVGPVDSLDALFQTPHEELEGCHNLTLRREKWPELELKFNPLDTGMRMKELPRFFKGAQDMSWRARTLRAPDEIDHLLISLLHFHKHGFCGWGWLYDIHLLTRKISEAPPCWDEFLRRCRLEGIETSAWQGFVIATERLDSPVPAHVMTAVKPRPALFLHPRVLASVSTEFIWNCNSLPMLVSNALIIGDRKRKLETLTASFFPAISFLSAYYAGNGRIYWWNYLPYLFLHWLVLILPGGVIRHTVGPVIWRQDMTAGKRN